MALNPTGPDSDTTDARIAELYRQAAQEDSPRHLDIALMAAAREGIEMPRPAKRPWWISWQTPFAVAALAIVSVSLVTLMTDEGGDRVRQLESSQAPARPSASSESAATESTPAPPRVSAPAVQPEVRSERAPKQASTHKQGAATPPAAGGVSGAREPVEERKALDMAVARDKPAPATPATTGSSDVAQYSSAPAMAPPPAAASTRGRMESGSRSTEDRAAAGPTTSARSTPLLKAEPQLHRQELGAAASSETRPREVERHVRELESESARVWLERIQLLRREGRGVEAKELLAEFKRRFPEEALPVELR